MDYIDYNIFFDSNDLRPSTSGAGTLNINATIKSESEDTALLGLQNFSFYNTFNNISSPNNVVRIVNTMYNAATGAYYNLDTTFTIPDGNYNIQSLLDYINENCNQTINVTSGGPQGPANYTTNTSADAAYLFLGFGYNPLSSSSPAGSSITPIDGVQVQAHSNSFLQSNGSGQYNNKFYNSSSGEETDPYVYLGLYYVVDSTTTPILNMLGIDLTGANTYGNPFRGVGFTISQASLLASTNVFNTSTVSFVYLCSQILSSTNTRATNALMDDSSVIAILPVNAEYGFQCHYQQNPPIFSEINISSLKQIDFVFYNNNKEIISFNGTPWGGCMTLRLFPAILQETDKPVGPPTFDNPNRNHLMQDQPSKKRAIRY